ncbi:MAG: hypothetical protein CME62_02300 [Halobacteriovoraceae bacterium]|nr:hypothetical protein [Halobacteriovoraceae bacterium]|tara:strand:- start:2933 stop:3859 length:927 start_codon:yes stop_codon:yes gene_type:complete
MQIRASVDIGSNSVLLLMAQISDHHFDILANESRVTGLGRGLDDTGLFCDEAMVDTFQALTEYKLICEKNKIDPSEVIVTATEASRVASNAQSFFQKIKDELGFSITIISGLGEAYYSTTGVLFDKNIDSEIITIMDIGGASTELIQVETKSQNIRSSFSMPVGVVRMTNWRDKGCELENLQEVLSRFSLELSQVKTNQLYCVAGTMTSIANMLLGHKDFIEEEVHGFQFEKTQLTSLIEKTEEYTPEEFLSLYPFLGKRSQTIKAGLKLAKNVLDVLECKRVYVSTYGLRYGTILAGQIEEKYVWTK